VTFAPDPALPARDLLLDPTAMSARLGALLGAWGPVRVEDCEREWARYDPGHSLRMVYRARVDGTPRLISAHAFTDRRAAERAVRRAAAQAVSTPPLRPVVADAALNTVYWTFPNDRLIASLGTIAGPSATLDGLLGRPVEPRVIAYAPERAATARCVDRRGTTVAYAKAFAHAGDARRARRVARALAQRAAARGRDLQIPRVIAFSAPHRLLVSEALDGPRVADGATDEEAMHRLGDALGRFHQLAPPSGLAARGIEAAALRRAAELVACASPASAERATRLVDDLLDRRPDAEPPVCLHGDLNVRNVILDGDRAALIDLDDVGLGPAASDLGRTLAGLRSRREVGALGEGAEARLVAALLEGYGGVRALPAADSLRWHTAASLLINRAAAAVTWVSGKWAQRLPAVLGDAREVLG
jgi:Ser/Thr protein kinase RdoA (MazF antagonist)